MTKKQIFYFGLFASIITLSSGFRPFQSELFPWFHVFEKEITYTVPTEVEVGQTFFDIPFTGKTFVGFQQSLAARESQGKYHKVNSFGYLGKYQFGTETLEELGINDEQNFLKSRKLQEKAFIAYLARNKWDLRKEIERYSGKVIRGIPITESGILAAAHLGGPGSVKRFLRSGGRKKFVDGFGTSIAEYLREFAGYDTSFIEANKKAKANYYVY
ncbi:peptidoglycan-binding protein LysM [Flavobacterium amniphilum]|uniref:peptidoglycan-binding protein LysM n=1 Tax=Flavobacterium amniphilum TaxID=1834035 RepID=UPI00202A1938|nr:peptidoglycan-binding protein LysM [Flavobacterium amniphilum]MCL9806127.1 peptidoglycan-binding protein LysM [Flavobacterium amniphilum]